MWDVGQHIAFSPPMVQQLRTPHNPLADMAAENDLYFKSHELIKFLRLWNGTASTLPGRFEELTIQLYERGYLELGDVQLTQQWLLALTAIGYKFPGLTHKPWQLATGLSTHALAATERLPGSTGQKTCTLLGTEYDCSALLDWQYYAKHNNITGITNSTAAMQHWLATGIAQGSRSHGGKRVLKIVMMTKDAWPAVRSWVLYHADVFGGENLYIIDGSKKGSHSYAWLQQSMGTLGFHVFHSGHMGFDDINRNMQQLLSSLRYSADFLVKMDTDEYMGLFHEQGSCWDPAFNCSALGVEVGSAVRQYLDGLEVKSGNLLLVNYTMWSLPANSCLDNPALLTTFSPVVDFDGTLSNMTARQQWSNAQQQLGSANILMATHKSMFVAPAFQATDLGGHGGVLQPQYKGAGQQKVSLVLIHFHHTCYDEVVANSKLAVMAHGYLKDDMPHDMQMAKCRSDLANFRGSSWHKVACYCAHVQDPVGARQKYYKQFTDLLPSRMMINFNELARIIKKLEATYGAN